MRNCIYKYTKINSIPVTSTTWSSRNDVKEILSFLNFDLIWRKN